MDTSVPPTSTSSTSAFAGTDKATIMQLYAETGLAKLKYVNQVRQGMHDICHVGVKVSHVMSSHEFMSCLMLISISRISFVVVPNFLCFVIIWLSWMVSGMM